MWNFLHLFTYYYYSSPPDNGLSLTRRGYIKRHIYIIFPPFLPISLPTPLFSLPPFPSYFLLPSTFLLPSSSSLLTFPAFLSFPLSLSHFYDPTISSGP